MAAALACAVLLAACDDSAEPVATTATTSTTGSTSSSSATSASTATGSVAFAAAIYSVTQAAGTLTVAVNRAGGSSGAASVAYATANGTAAAGTDYVASSGTLSWADGEASPKFFSVPISNATMFTGSRSFTVTLSGPGGGASVGAPASATVTIAGGAGAGVAAGSLALSASGYQVMQNAGTLFAVVNRTGGASGTVSVSYGTANGSAVAGVDYSAASGTLLWGDGEAGSKALPVPISNATPFAGSRTFTIALTAPTNGAAIGSVGTALVAIGGSSGSGSGLAGSTFWVYQKGIFNWAGDVSYGGLAVNYSSTAGGPTEGPYTISATGNNGGFQPRAQNDDFDTTPYRYLTIVLKPTIPNQAWVSGFAAVGDVPVGVLVNVTNYGPKPPVVGQWNTYRIPLGAGGYQMATGSHIYKVTFQDETANQPGYAGPTNVWYVDSIAFTAN